MGFFFKCVFVKFVQNEFVLTKDLVYYESFNLLNHMSLEGFSKSLAFFKTTLVKISVLCIFQGQRSSDISDWFIDYT